MLKTKHNIFVYSLVTMFSLIFCLSEVNAEEYQNYFGIKITSSEYNTLLNLGFSEDEIFYMNEETYLENKDLDAKMVARTEKFYKTVYTDLNGNPYTTEVTKEEYENQPTQNTRGTVTTEYKQLVSVISQNGNKYRFKVSQVWRQIPSTKSFDIIGIGFDDDVYIDSSVYFNYSYCLSSGSCSTESYYIDRKSTATGGTAVYDLPNSFVSLGATLYYDVSKINPSSTITKLTMYGDYAHAQSSVPANRVSNHGISAAGLELYSGLAGYYDTMPEAISQWTGTW